MDFEKVLKKRKSVKRFADKRPDWRKILQALELTRYSSFAGNQNVLKFILVKDLKKIRQLSDACQQRFVADVSYVVVAVSNDETLKRSYGIRGEKYARQQAGAQIQNFLLGLTEIGYVTCWVGHFVDEQVKRILGISKDLVVEALFPIGRETKLKTPEKIKPSFENMVYFDKWKNRKMDAETRVSVENV